jgi:tetratricopeptide (TPR) repeat protein
MVNIPGIAGEKFRWMLEKGLEKGNDLYIPGMYQEAVKAYDEVLSRDPDRVTAWYKKGLALGELGRISKRQVPVVKRGN